MWVAPVGRHRVQMAVACEHDLPAVGRPARLAVLGTAVRESTDIRAARGHHVDLPVAVAVRLEGDAAPVGRPGWSKVGTVAACQLDEAAAACDVDVRRPG